MGREATGGCGNEAFEGPGTCRCCTYLENVLLTPCALFNGTVVVNAWI